MPAIDIGARLLVLLQAGADATRRFPVAVVGCLLASLATLLLVRDIRLVVGEAPLTEWFVWIGLGLTLGGFNAALVTEARSWPRAPSLGAALLAGLAVAAPLIWFGSVWAKAMLIAGLALGLLALPSRAARHKDDAAWAYGAGMVGQGGLAFGAAVVVDLGIELLFFLLRVLLSIEVPSPLHMDTTIVAFGVLAPLLLFGGVDRPADFAVAATMAQWLRLFMAWICVPLALAYLAIFELYIARLAISRDLPEGQLSWLTIGIAGLGVLAHLLAYPYREQGPSWVRFYYRVFFPALIPVLAVFALSVWVRIDAYGITEARYVLCLLLLWLSLLAAMSLIGRYRPVFVPALLTILLILGSVGPWSATTLAVRSQVERLAGLLAETGRLEGGKLAGTAASGRVGQPEQVDAASIVRFLIDRGAQERLAALFDTRPGWASERPLTRASREKLATTVLADLGFVHGQEGEPARIDTAGFGRGMQLDIAPFDSLVWLRADDQSVEPTAVGTAAGRFGFDLDAEKQVLTVTLPDNEPVRFDLGVLARRWRTKPPSTLAEATIERRIGNHRVSLVVRYLEGTWRAQTQEFEPTALEGLVLIR
jgi:hypothetical protein